MKKASILLLCVLMFSCTSVKKTDDEIKPVVYITDDIQLELPDLELLDENLEMQQIIDGRYKDKTYTMPAYLLLNRQEISIVVFTALGNTVYELYYSGGEVKSSGLSSVVISNPLYMIADLQFCYYPEDSLKEIMDDAGIRMEVQTLEGGWTRQFFADDDLIIEIKRVNNILEYTNYLRDYSYRIEEYPV
ncbi:DUF3261 domain-containing protein [Oceanispirochaeta sp. M1]|uniref:DUF3261 domain-containing protein n=2 Tax=Oceanispirochaeta TaxID=2035349 RepID=UPI0011C0531F|nr:DUF3261 domain-containing protein [Oceanispirochaeta sp. M1]MBF9015485.1 DUF3261 domain-containing protein [Oceanispirochaeta sp. M2]